MHMADALVSPAVAVTMYAASAAAAGVSLVQFHKEEAAAPELAKKKLPTMAVMSALVFAGQMINYTIPGTGSSGHLCGGMLLSAILGPWAGFLSMIVILAIQALFFADGGLLALGANVWNMAFYGCFVGYFLIYRPLMQGRLLAGKGRTKLVLPASRSRTSRSSKCTSWSSSWASSKTLSKLHTKSPRTRVRGLFCASKAADAIASAVLMTGRKKE